MFPSLFNFHPNMLVSHKAITTFHSTVSIGCVQRLQLKYWVLKKSISKYKSHVELFSFSFLFFLQEWKVKPEGRWSVLLAAAPSHYRPRWSNISITFGIVIHYLLPPHWDSNTTNPTWLHSVMKYYNTHWQNPGKKTETIDSWTIMDVLCVVL